MRGPLTDEVNELPLGHVAGTEEQAGEKERVELVRGRRLVYQVRVCIEQVKRYHIAGNFRGRKFSRFCGYL